MSTFIFKIKKDLSGRWPGMDFGSRDNEDRLRMFLQDNDGKFCKIDRKKTVRSLSQNNLYWMYLELIERETGNTAMYLHEYFRRTLLPPVFLKVLGKEIKIPASTKDLSKVEFGEYLDKISAETNVPIPDTASFAEYKDSAPMIGDEVDN